MDSKHGIIMMVYLGDYPNAAKNRDYKFKRAIESFLSNDYQNKELIIVADGCEKAHQIYKSNFAHYENIKFILAPKQPSGYPGFLRQVGIYFSTAETISYLDADDYISPNFITHLKKHFEDLPESQMLYYDSLTVDVLKEYMSLEEIKNEGVIEELESHRWTRLPSSLEYQKIGTGNIAHRRHDDIKWQNWDKITRYSEDWTFIKKWIDSKHIISKVKIDKHYLCHFIIGDTKRNIDV
jgi:glycosyltransferase involved in cell wall biosynthesis